MARASRDPGREFIPPVMKIRLRYTKRDRLRFTSVRDFQRAFERALRRCNVPMAYSAGFRPHPKISYANAAPTGAGSEAEFVEIGLVQERDPQQLLADLNAALPTGLDIVQAVVADGSDLVARLEASVWQLEFVDTDPALVTAAAEKLLESDIVEVTRVMKSGPRTFDVRSSIRAIDHRIEGNGDDAYAILAVVVSHGTPSVRPDDVLAALNDVANLVPSSPVVVTRLAQGPLNPDGRGVGDPLA